MIEELAHIPQTGCIGINGIDGAGKTTVAVSLAEALREKGRAVELIHVDDFNDKQVQQRVYRAYSAGAFSQEFFELYYQHSIDYVRLAEAIRQAKAQTETLIVEGVFLFRPPVVGLIDYKVFVQIEPELARQRYAMRAARDGDLRPVEVFDHIWRPAFERYCAEYKPRSRADKILSQ